MREVEGQNVRPYIGQDVFHHSQQHIELFLNGLTHTLLVILVKPAHKNGLVKGQHINNLHLHGFGRQVGIDHGARTQQLLGNVVIFNQAIRKQFLR